MTRVLVVGDTALDHYLVVSAGPDEKPVVRRSQRCLGGTGANAAVAAARLGAEVTLATRLGSDPIADWLAAALDQTGLRATHIERADGDSMLATIIDDGVRRQVFVDPGVGIDPGLPALESEPACIYLSYATAATADLLTRGTEALVVVGVEHWMLSDPELLTVLDGADLVVTNAAGWDSWSGPAETPVARSWSPGERPGRSYASRASPHSDSLHPRWTSSTPPAPAMPSPALWCAIWQRGARPRRRSAGPLSPAPSPPPAGELRRRWPPRPSWTPHRAPDWADAAAVPQW